MSCILCLNSAPLGWRRQGQDDFASKLCAVLRCLVVVIKAASCSYRRLLDHEKQPTDYVASAAGYSGSLHAKTQLDVESLGRFCTQWVEGKR